MAESPTFISVPFPAAKGLPDNLRQEFVPQQLFNLYRVDPVAQALDLKGETIWAFGSEANLLHVGVSTRTGHVLTIPHGCLDRTPKVINSSLSQFTKCAEEVLKRFPYFAAGDEDHFQVVAQEVRAMIDAIDPLAFEEDSMWETFYWDLTMGDCNTEQILGSSQ